MIHILKHRIYILRWIMPSLRDLKMRILSYPPLFILNSSFLILNSSFFFPTFTPNFTKQMPNNNKHTTTTPKYSNSRKSQSAVYQYVMAFTPPNFLQLADNQHITHNKSTKARKRESTNRGTKKLPSRLRAFAPSHLRASHDTNYKLINSTTKTKQFLKFSFYE